MHHHVTYDILLLWRQTIFYDCSLGVGLHCVIWLYLKQFGLVKRIFRKKLNITDVSCGSPISVRAVWWATVGLNVVDHSRNSLAECSRISALPASCGNTTVGHLCRPLWQVSAKGILQQAWFVVCRSRRLSAEGIPQWVILECLWWDFICEFAVEENLRS